MKKTATADAVFVAVFAVFVALPNLHFSSAEVSTKENRTLAAFKPLFVAGHFNEAFPSDFEAFYADRFFTRDALLALSQSLTSHFVVSKQTIGNESVLIGQEGWLFMREHDMERNFLNIDYFSEDEMKIILKYLCDIKRFCDERGKLFVFFLAPEKNKIYGEFYPDIMKNNKQNPDTKSSDLQLIEFIKNNSDVKVVYPYERLLQAKQNGDLLYYKHDMHWNALGAYFGYVELCNVLQIKPIEITGYQESTNALTSLIDLFPSGTKNYREEPVYKIPKINTSAAIIETQIDGVKKAPVAISTCEGKKLNAVIFGDSFARTWGQHDDIEQYGLLTYIADSFSTVYLFRRRDIQRSDLEVLSKSDVVILECVRSNLRGLLNITFPTFD